MHSCQHNTIFHFLASSYSFLRDNSGFSLPTGIIGSRERASGALLLFLVYGIQLIYKGRGFYTSKL